MSRQALVGLPQVAPHLKYRLSTPHFTIHYNYRSEEAATLDPTYQKEEGIDPLPIHGVFDFQYVEACAECLETAWNYYVNLKGYCPPLGYREDRKCDVYLLDVIRNGVRVAGTTTIDDRLTDPHVGFQIRNRWGTGWREFLQATCSHELFHSIQFSYCPGLHARPSWLWWAEATATYMEGQVFPENRDYFCYLSAWFDSPDVSLDIWDRPDWHEYGAALFCEYIEAQWGKGEIIRSTFEKANEYGTALEAIRSALPHEAPQLASSVQPDIFGLYFAVANYLLIGEPWQYPHGDAYRRHFAHMFAEKTWYSYPRTSGECELDHLAAQYYILEPPAQPGKLSLLLKVLGDHGIPCPIKGVVIALPPKGHPYESAVLMPVWHSSMQVYVANLDLERFQQSEIEQIVLVVANCSYGDLNRDNVRYAISAQ